MYSLISALRSSRFSDSFSVSFALIEVRPKRKNMRNLECSFFGIAIDKPYLMIKFAANICYSENKIKDFRNIF
jgi:hypothetical protein